ncbi:acyl-CoA N-acyltransferase [Heliocybe sulcata]|uniref:Acyl-CoA N-acyltransferase n=1 Tax=Heliocybe sulcata TaxID=5364 RepID=A0A5C3N413_9AGAM|nr:acyl-CoA N-acyltransferase [Heliocybe sulcata]
MATISIRQLVKPTSEELDAAGAVVASAMEDDAFTAGCVGGDKKFVFPFHRATCAAAAIGGQLWVASCGETDIAGVAAWFGPGQALLYSPEQGEAGYNDLFQAFSPGLTKWWMEYFLPKYEEQTTKALGERVKLGAWHLQLFAVLPELQGKGLGSALVRPVLEKAAAERKPICLETEAAKNLPIYEHWGLVVKSEERYESSTGGFPMWVMYKQV